MRIDQNIIQRFRLSSFYDKFKELYGEIITDSEINNLLEKNEFVTVGLVPNMFIYHEIDLPSNDISDYFIALKENNTFKPRFIIKWKSIPLKKGGITHIIGEVKVNTDIELNELFCESHEFSIITSDENEIDLKFLEQLANANDINEEASIMQQHLKEIIVQEDSRSQRAKYLLSKYHISDD